jgi:5-formyltetrahydrofolate cyclo-ligase
MNILEEKKLLRQEFKKRRALLTKKEVLQKSQLICENFINNLLPKIIDCRVANAPRNDEGVDADCRFANAAGNDEGGGLDYFAAPRNDEVEGLDYFAATHNDEVEKLDCRVASAPRNDENRTRHHLNPQNNSIPSVFASAAKQSSQITFSLYLSANNEVETKFIKEFFIKNNINFSYPKITKLNSHLEFIEYKEDLIFTKNNFFPSILEPQTGKKILPDILIIPLLAFDNNLSRLGMGGGFFDRTISFLKTKKSKIATIGLAYDMQCFEKNLAIEKTDSSLDFIVSESCLFSKN